MPGTLCRAMYFSVVMKVPFSRGSCTSRSHPHCSHARDIHWRGSELVVMLSSSQPAAAYPFGVLAKSLGGPHHLHYVANKLNRSGESGDPVSACAPDPGAAASRR